MSNTVKPYEPANLHNALEDAGRTTLAVRMSVLTIIMQRDRCGCALTPEEAAIVEHVKRAMMTLDSMSRRVLAAVDGVLGPVKD